MVFGSFGLWKKDMGEGANEWKEYQKFMGKITYRDRKHGTQLRKSLKSFNGEKSLKFLRWLAQGTTNKFYNVDNMEYDDILDMIDNNTHNWDTICEIAEAIAL